MTLFVIPDLHGHFSSLEGLLKRAGVIDDEGNRVEGITTVSVGDLANAVDDSIDRDSECLLKVRDWIDTLLIGNHEMGWIWSWQTFGGFYNAPQNGSLYRQLMREGIVKPAYLVEEHNLLITHAGVHRNYDFSSAREAYRAIMNAFETQPSSWHKLGTIGQVPKRYLLSGESRYRGGIDPIPSIFWKDWKEPMNKSFSQIVGHTPISKPDLWRREDGTFSVNIDCGGKRGRGATGMFFDNGKIEFVSFELEPELASNPA